MSTQNHCFSNGKRVSREQDQKKERPVRGGGGVLVPGLLKQMARPWQDHCRLLFRFYHALPKGRRTEDAYGLHRRPPDNPAAPAAALAAAIAAATTATTTAATTASTTATTTASTTATTTANIKFWIIKQTCVQHNLMMMTTSSL